MKPITYAVGLLTVLFSAYATANTMDDVAALQKRWAEVNYTLKDKDQQKAFEDLVAQANTAVDQNKGRAEVLVWRGIIESSYAGAKGGLGALSLAKAAKSDLEQALKIDDKVLMGSAYTSLGTLYSKVPGWPLGFGDDDKAEVMLKKALSINPTGIDSNYFYGSYLLDQHKYQDAETYLVKAQNAPARPTRPLADKGRQEEIAKALDQVRYQLKNKEHAGITN